MKKRIVKLLSVVLIFALLLSVLPTQIFAADTSSAGISKYSNPLDKGNNVTQAFGKDDGKDYNKDYRGHLGTDYAGGKYVLAVADGKVYALKKTGENGGWGTYVILEHTTVNGKHYYSRYAHMVENSTGDLKVGSLVKAGTKLGRMGNTGVGSKHVHLQFSSKPGGSGYAKGDAPKLFGEKYNGLSVIKGGVTFYDPVQVLKTQGKCIYGTETKAIACSISTSVSSVSNSAATIQASKPKKVIADTEKWYCGIGTKAEVTAMQVSGTKAQNVASTDTFSYQQITLKNDTFKLTKAGNQALQPGTKYYYRVCLCIGGYYYQSGVKSFTTTIDLPEKSTVTVADGDEKVGREDGVQVSWTETRNTVSYTLTVKDASGNVIQAKEGLQGKTFVLDPIDIAGEYTVTVSSVGNTGTVVEGSSAAFTVMEDVPFRFYDTVSDEILAEGTVTYGHGVTAPASPSHRGYSFVKWDKQYDRITEDTTINTVFTVSTYTVQFIDSLTNEVLGKAQSVQFGTAASAPTNLNFSQHSANGYDFVGWDRDFSCIEDNTNVYAVFKRQDNLPSAILTLNSVTPHEGTTQGTSVGYDISCTVENNLIEKISGRIVAVLKSEDGTILTQTDSTAFVVDESTFSAGGVIDRNSRTVNFFVKYPQLADQIELYLVNDYATLGQMSEKVVQTINNTGMSSDWILYEGECPVQGENVIVDDEWSETETVHYYRYRRRLASTATATPDGFIREDGYTLVNRQQKTNTYVASWPSGFLKSNSLYKKYNVPAITASETDTQKTVIDSTATAGYIYWHWCYGEYKNGPINRWIEGAKGNQCETFHAFYTTSAVSFNTSSKAYKKSNASVCTDTYWWHGKTPDKEGNLVVKKQTYSVYDKQYSYLSEYSDWIPYTDASELPTEGAALADGTTCCAIETREETHVWHRYRYESLDETSAPDPASVISVSMPIGDADLTGEVTAWIYKYSQASDFTTEYVGTTTIVEEDGQKRIELNDIVLREAQYRGGPDYTIAISVPGYEQAFIIGTIEAPKKLCTVNFYDEFKQLVKTVTVEEGDSVPLEEQPVLTVEAGQLGEGKMFAAWQASLTDIRHETLHVYPVLLTKQFTITKVDWNSQTISFAENCAYGDELPEISEKPAAVEGYESDWYVMTEDGYVPYDEYRAQAQTVSSNLLIVSQNTPKLWTVTVIDADYDRVLSEYATSYDIMNAVNGVTGEVEPEEPEEAETRSVEPKKDVPDALPILATLEVENASPIEYSELLNVEESDRIEFHEWVNAVDDTVFDGSEVTQNMVIYPNYIFPDSVMPPEADADSGEYSDAITVALTCATENAVIRYTVNGEDPSVDPNAVIYTGPITISNHTVLRYYATAAGYNDSMTATSYYAINDGNEPIKHLVSFIPVVYDSEDNPYDIFTVLIDDNAPISSVLSELAEVDCYVLSGLSVATDSGDLIDIDINTPITASIEVYLMYTPEQHTVTFLDAADQEIESKTVVHGEAVEPPTDTPEKDGFLFAGWDADLTEITEDLTVRPRFLTEDEYASVALTKSSVSLYVGNLMKLEATVTPDDHSDYEIIWYSEDNGIASVDEDGFVTGEAAGTTRIVAELPHTGAKAYCTVKVSYDPEDIIDLCADGHTPGEAVEENYIAPTCTEPGSYDSVVYCSICGEQLSCENTEVSPLGHDTIEVVLIEATCTEEGASEFSCSRCDYYEATFTPALDHDYIEVVLIGATCTEEGASEFSCSRCDYYEAKFTPALGHDYVVTSETPATCTSDGSRVSTCSRCPETQTEVLPKTGHSYEMTEETPATCETDGSRTYVCSNCTDTYTDTVSALGHNYEGKVLIVPTCVKQGLIKYTCTRPGCGSVYSEKTDPAHSFGTPVDNGDGTHTLSCTLCDYTVTELHTYTDGVCACGAIDPDAKQFEIVSASLLLNEDLNMVYAAQIPDGCTDAYMVFNFLGVDYTAEDYTVNEDGQYCFELSAINPQCMGDTITATLHATIDGKEYTDTIAEYSVRDYCVNQLAKTDDAKLKTLLSDILTYGASAQNYVSYKTDELVTEGLDLTPSTFNAISGKTVSFTGEQDANTCWTGAALVLSNDLATRFTFVTDSTDGLTIEVSINGRTQTFDAFEDAGNGRYYITFDGIQATEFDDTVTATFSRDGEPLGAAVNYSVSTYICSTQNVENANLQALVRALYNYGASAKAYADTNK